MTKSSGDDGTLRTFVTLRIMGDRLDPEEVTRILKINPTLAYAKGENYFAGRESGNRKGRTGVWLFSTDRGIKSNNLEDHVGVLIYLLVPSLFDHEVRALRLHTKTTQRMPKISDLVEQESKIRYLRSLMKEKSLTASVSFFWHGREGVKPPSIPRVVTTLFKQVPIAVEIDFATDADMEPVSIPA